MSDREVLLFGLLVGAVALYFYSTTDSGQSVLASATDAISGAFVNRGIRNCNPGNLERTPGIRWANSFQSQAECEAAGRVWDTHFEVFYTMADGVRAVGHDLRTAVSEGFNTISTLVPHYAPPFENDIIAYENAVSQFMSKDANEGIDPNSELPLLTAAVMSHETGYTDSLDNIASEVYAA